MKKKFKQMTAVLLSIVMVAIMIPIGVVSVSAITRNEVVSQLDSLMNQYVGRTATSNEMYMGSQCKGFANWVFLQIFGVYIGPYPENAKYRTNTSTADVLGELVPGSLNEASCKELLQKGAPGDFIQVQRSTARGSGPHSMILVNVNNDGIEVFDANSDGKNTIKRYWLTYSEFDVANKGMSLCRAKGYDPTPTPTVNNPIGSLDSLTASYGVINIGGWAFDNDDINAQLNIHVYIGGGAGDPNAEGHSSIVANGYRPDVNNVYGCGEYHGYGATISTSKTGEQTVFIYAINVGSGENTVIGSGTVNIPVHNPVTCIDRIEGRESAVYVKGWAFDEDDLNASVALHVYIGGIASDSNAEGHVITANVERTDVNDVYGCGVNHGFKATIPTSKKGTQPVYIYAINIGSGSNVFVGEGTVEISEDTERPTIEQYYTSHIEHDKYRVCVIPKDNVGIKLVRIATWSQDDQSDLVWHKAENNGVGTYFVDINRSNYSKTGNSLYHNHIYVYDYAGNERFRSIDMDYKITSDTGKNIAEGEYRIITAVDDNKALDVDGASNVLGTNVQIYSNLSDMTQTYNLVYDEDGFYTILSHYTGRAIDILNDNYEVGTNVVISKAHYGANQKWMITPTEDGYYTFTACSNGLALDVCGGYSENKTNVQVWTPNNTTAQKWKLRRVLNQGMIKVTSWTLSNGIMKPVVDIRIDNKKLVENIDFTVTSYIENDVLFAKISGIGNFCDSVVVEYQEIQFDTGDTNLDGRITISDVTAIQRHLAELKHFTDEQLALADTNGDGKVDINDATHLQKYLAEFDGIVLDKQTA